MTTAIVLGAGIVGSVIGADLAEGGWAVTIADRSPDALHVARRRSRVPVETLERDLSDAQVLADLVAPFDLVIGALPGALGFRTLERLIDAGKDCCDISFMPEDALELDERARAQGVTAIVDCGVAPGLSNLLAGYAAARLDPCRRVEIYVGGLPRERTPPFEYKAAFSPADVLEEFVRPARLVVGGQVVTREALEELETLELPGVPPLEAFLTDGLRSLVETLDVPDMKEKTLRYPGHARLMHAFRETGLFGRQPVDVKGVRVKPLDLLETLLFPRWAYAEGEEDLTVMRVLARGQESGRPTALQWDLLDHYDREKGWPSMARTTGFPCAIFARLLAGGRIPSKGVLPPERLGGEAGIVEHVFAELAARGVEVRTSHVA